MFAGTITLFVGYFNPRTPHGVRPGIDICKKQGKAISIHAPLTGCDVTANVFGVIFDISIHAPLTGCDGSPLATLSKAFLFQSTHPSRGATPMVWKHSIIVSFQSTHPSRGATSIAQNRPSSAGISIHAPLTGCDESLYQFGIR